MCTITNCEYLHCSLESTFHTYKNVLKGDFCSQWLMEIIHHSLVIVYTDSSEFPWYNCQMYFLSILAFLQLFSLDYSIFFSFLCLAHDIFWEIACHFFVHAVGQNILFILLPRAVSILEEIVATCAFQCSQATLGTSGKDHSCQSSRDSTGDSGIHCNISLFQLILKYLASNCSQWNDNGKGIHCTLLVRELFLPE